MRSARALAWEAALAAAVALVRLMPRVPVGERRTFGIQVRRAIPRRAVEALVDLAERDASARERSAEVLRWIGLDAAEVIIERLVQGEAVGVRAFYYDVLGGMDGVYPLVTPMLTSHWSHEVRHGAALLGRMGQPAAVADLATLLTHRDESVRVVAVRAIGEIHDGPAAEPLRQALHDSNPRTRAAAAEAIAEWRGGALALLLAAALDGERDRDAWQALVTSLGRIGTAQTCDALAMVALTPPECAPAPGLFHRPASRGRRGPGSHHLAHRADDARAPGARGGGGRGLRCRSRAARRSGSGPAEPVQRCTSNPSMCRSRL